MDANEDFYKLIKPTVYLARCFALVPFSLNTAKFRKMFLIASVFVPTYMIFGISQVYVSMYNNPILPKFEKLMLILQVTASSSTSISSWFVNHTRFKNVIALMDHMNRVESLLVPLGMDLNVKYRKRIQWIFISVIVFMVLQNIFDNIILGENILGLFIIYTIAMLTLSHFLLLICTCQQYYKFINDKLKTVGGLTSEGLTDIVKLSKDIFRDSWAVVLPFHERAMFTNVLKVAMESHSDLFEICNSINKYFGLQTLANVTAQILNVTSICYYVPALVIDESDKPHHYMIISIKSVAFISCFAFVQLWVMAYVCSTTCDQVQHSNLCLALFRYMFCRLV